MSAEKQPFRINGDEISGLTELDKGILGSILEAKKAGKIVTRAELAPQFYNPRDPGPVIMGNFNGALQRLRERLNGVSSPWSIVSQRGGILDLARAPKEIPDQLKPTPPEFAVTRYITEWLGSRSGRLYYDRIHADDDIKIAFQFVDERIVPRENGLPGFKVYYLTRKELSDAYEGGFKKLKQVSSDEHMRRAWDEKTTELWNNIQRLKSLLKTETDEKFLGEIKRRIRKAESDYISRHEWRTNGQPYIIF